MPRIAAPLLVASVALGAQAPQAATLFDHTTSAPFPVLPYLVATVLSLILGRPVVGRLVKAVDRRMGVKASDKPFHGGSLMGIIERQLYLYALLSFQISLLPPIFAVKTFALWLGKAEGEQVDTGLLGRFYAYIAGSFLSLGLALVIFEAIRSLIYYWPAASDLLHRF